MRKFIHVAAAAIFDQDGRLLLALRSKEQHQGGLWEFPGGKVEAGENVRDALARELYEELGIEIDQSATSPLIQVPYHYPDKSVLLDVYRVVEFEGDAWGKEGQPLQWIDLKRLPEYEFPAANKPIVNALLLPKAIAITPELLPEEYPGYIAGLLKSDADAVMLRAKHLDELEQQDLFSQLKAVLTDSGKPLIWNGSVEQANKLGIQCLHLSSGRLQGLSGREEYNGLWLGASCHSESEISLAVEKGLDYITLSPVNNTQSHPDTEPLGWRRFIELVAESPIPVYALGGVAVSDMGQVIESGGQGIAGISGFMAS